MLTKKRYEKNISLKNKQNNNKKLNKIKLLPLDFHKTSLFIIFFQKKIENIWQN